VMESVPALSISAGGIVTDNDVAETYCVASDVAPAETDEFAANPVPVKVTVAATVAMGICAGVTFVNTGRALLIVNIVAAVVGAPPRPGFVTPMVKLPEPRKNDAESVPDNVVAETNVVGTAVPANVIVEPFLKLVPETWIDVAAAPAFADVGEKPFTVGVGLRTLTVNDDAPPPGNGFVIRPERLPGFASCAAGRLNVIALPETVPATPPSVAAVLLLNPVPVTVMLVAEPPALILDGETPVIDGMGFGGAVMKNAMG
jgi:hypothetical protein